MKCQKNLKYQNKTKQQKKWKKLNDKLEKQKQTRKLWNEMNHAAKTKQKKNRPKYTHKTQRQRSAYLALINQTPNQTGVVCIHFGVSGSGNGGGGGTDPHALTQLLLFYYLNFLHTFLPLFSFFMWLLCVSCFCCHLHSSWLDVWLFVPFKCVVFISIMTQWKLIIRDLIALHLHVMFAELLWLGFDMEQPSALIVDTHFWYII